MSEPAEEWRSDYYLILPHPDEPRILGIAGAGGWSLPRYQLAERAWPPHVNLVGKQVRELLGIEATVLLCVYAAEDEAARLSRTIYLLENQSPARQPPSGGGWFGPDGLGELDVAWPEQATPIAAYFHEAASGVVPEFRASWARRGWFSAAAAWIEARLKEGGYELLSPVEQFKTWGISCLLVAHTTSGDFYFKEASKRPLFADEPALTTALAELYPDHVPRPLAIDRERGWMLLPDIGPSLRGNQDLATWEAMYHAFATVQVDSAARIDALLAAGCLDRRLDVLETQIDTLIGDPEALDLLERTEAEQLRGSGPQLQALCRQLDAIGLPPTLAHGDFHPGNITLHNGRYTFFDWTDAAVSHPFFDVAPFWDWYASAWDDPQALDRLRDSYLAHWTAYASPERLKEAFALAKPVGALHQAVSYLHIVKNVEPLAKPECASGVPDFLRVVLRALPEPVAPAV